jgi:putative ABC transport system permease protein
MVRGPRSALHVKLLRDLWRMRAQSFAIALVIAAGVGMVIMSLGMLRSLEASRDDYYRSNRFAELFAPLRRAPEPLMRQVRTIPGIGSAQSRITAGATLDLPGVDAPASARIHSLPEGEAAINRLVLRSGRLPDPARADEAVISEAFGEANALVPGDTLAALLYGNRVTLRVTGTVIAPDHIYSIGPGSLFPDNLRFGIIWMNREPLAAALDLTESFNELVATLSPGAREEEVIRRLDLLLAPYGGTGAYGREEQISHLFLQSEIDSLKVMAQILPPIFLAVAAFLINMVLTRLIELERESIGLLKAFGFTNRAVMLHYAQLAVLLSLGGLVLGVLLGIWLGRGLAGLYLQFYALPALDFFVEPDIYLIALGATLAPAMLGAAVAVRRAARLTPAEAMRPPIPANYSSRRSPARSAPTSRPGSSSAACCGGPRAPCFPSPASPPACRSMSRR